MSDDEYEALPAASTMSTHMIAGAFAGIMEHSIVYPVDCVKTRMQALVPDPHANYKNLYDAFKSIVKYEGLRSTLRGVNAMIGGAGPAHALYFACYEFLKKTFSKQTHLGSTLSYGLAGGFSTLLHDAVMNPADVVKQRMQVFKSPYSTCWQCLLDVYKQEGVRAFYRSYTTQLSMNIPFQSIHFIVYEYTQDLLNPGRHYNPVSHMASGAVAGATAAAATTPLDVCKTLLNTQERCAVLLSQSSAASVTNANPTAVSSNSPQHISGISQAFRTIYRFHGFSGFFKGISARCIYQMPSTAISWSVYEFFKYYLIHHSDVVSPAYTSAHPESSKATASTKYMSQTVSAVYNNGQSTS